jgi:Concanavalin A-like lectin/glucanases superfamily
MTAIYLDGFDHYGEGPIGATNMLDGTWATVGFEAAPSTPSWGARTGTLALSSTSFGGITSAGTRYILPAVETNIFMSFGYSIAQLPQSNNFSILCTFNDNANNVIAAVCVQTTGAISLLNGSTGAVLGTTQGQVITPQTWHLIEMNLNFSSGVFVLRVDDATASNTPSINLTGLTLPGASAPAQLTFNNSVNNLSQAFIDDLFIRNGSGSVNNGFLGDRRISTNFADADTATNNWTPNFYQVLGSAGILNNTFISDGGAGVPAAGTYINTASSLDIGSADFTLETFVRFQALPTGTNKATIFSRWDQVNNQRSYELFLGSVSLNSGNLVWQTSTDGTVNTVVESIVFPWTPDLDTWYHIAVVRASGEDLLFINGAQMGLPITDTATYFTGISPFGLGAEFDESFNLAANTSLQGWFNQARFTNGFARYTANFTPTTVEWPVGSADPHFSDVVLLISTDSLNVIQDISSFNQSITTGFNAIQQPVNDGPSVGAWSTVGKSVPDDNTFLEAPFVAASSVLTMTAQPTVGNTVTVGTTNGTTPAVYTFETSLTAAFQVLIDTNIQNTLQNLFNAINAGPGIGTKYGTGTTANNDVNATQLPAGQMMVMANIAGTAGNSIATSSSGITGGWTGSTLSGGLNIPGPTNFIVQRVPPTTTLISAVQITARAFKSAAGAGSINTALIGPLGGQLTGPTHALTIGPSYYNDIYETDPDTSGPISPTTLAGGSIQINRDT